jgi:hypothetical protein
MLKSVPYMYSLFEKKLIISIYFNNIFGLQSSDVTGTNEPMFILFGSILSNLLILSFQINKECESVTVTDLPALVLISYNF